MKRIIFAAFAVALIVGLGACGGSPSHHSTSPATKLIPPWSIKVPPESARTPDGAKPALPPPTFSFSLGGKHIDHAGLVLIEGFEGFSSCPYWDAYGRVWTRGYGETEGISQGSPCISRAFGEANLKSRVERFYEWAIRGIGVTFNQHEWDALCSFAWNLGAGIFTGSLRTSLQHHNPYPLLAYDHAGGVVLEGLARRRRAEVAFFLAPEPKVKPSRAQLLKERAELRADLKRHACWKPPKYGGGKWHRVCGHWRGEWAAVNRALA
jgi:lysozyme